MPGMSGTNTGNRIRMTTERQPISNFRPDRATRPWFMRISRSRSGITGNDQQYANTTSNRHAEYLIQAVMGGRQCMTMKIDAHFRSNGSAGNTPLPCIIQHYNRGTRRRRGDSRARDRGHTPLDPFGGSNDRRIDSQIFYARSIPSLDAMLLQWAHRLRQSGPNFALFRAETSANHNPPPVAHRFR